MYTVTHHLHKHRKPKGGLTQSSKTRCSLQSHMAWVDALVLSPLPGFHLPTQIKSYREIGFGFSLVQRGPSSFAVADTLNTPCCKGSGKYLKAESTELGMGPLVVTILVGSFRLPFLLPFRCSLRFSLFLGFLCSKDHFCICWFVHYLVLLLLFTPDSMQSLIC